MSTKNALAALAVWTLVFGFTGLSVGYGVMTAISCAFTTVVLLLMLLAVRISGWPAVWAVFVPYGLIGTVNIDLEGIFFDIFPWTAGLQLLLIGLLSAFAAAILLTYLTGTIPAASRTEPSMSRRCTYLPLRLFIVAFAYIILFFVAGALVFPYVSHFYQGRVMPSVRAIVGMEFVRGLVYALAMLPVARHLSGHRWRAAAILGLCLSVFGGIAPLLLPNNKYLPAEILPYHLVEVGCENFILGVIGAWFFVAKAADV
jgi:hypothetical protein